MPLHLWITNFWQGGSKHRESLQQMMFGKLCWNMQMNEMGTRHITVYKSSPKWSKSWVLDQKLANAQKQKTVAEHFLIYALEISSHIQQQRKQKQSKPVALDISNWKAKGISTDNRKTLQNGRSLHDIQQIKIQYQNTRKCDWLGPRQWHSQMSACVTMCEGWG